MSRDPNEGEVDQLDPVAYLCRRVKDALSMPLYLALDHHPTITSDALRQWATGRRRPSSERMREMAAVMRRRADAQMALAAELEAVAARMPTHRRPAL